MKKFKYDVLELISLVRDRSCLWDRTLEVYKDRMERRRAWEEIFGILDDKYEEMTAEDRRLLGEKVIYKWTNIRDTFMKSLKTRIGKPKRRYMLHNELKFLMKIVPEGECEEESTEGTEADMKQESEESVEEIIVTKKRPRKERDDSVPSKSKDYVLRKRSKRHDIEEVYSEENIEHGDDEIDFAGANRDPRVMNEDEAFFASLLPAVVKYNDEDKLEFRFGVLELMKRIKDSKKWVVEED